MIQSSLEKMEEIENEDSVVQDAPEFKENDVLLHPAHGLCKVKRLVNPRDGSNRLSYCLEPVRRSRSVPRFFVEVNHVASSGFHKPMALDEVKEILRYLRQGDTEQKEFVREDYVLQLRAISQQNTAFAFAKVLLYATSERLDYDPEERKIVKYAAEALIQEIAIVSNEPVKQVALVIKSHLQRYGSSHPWLHAILDRKGIDPELKKPLRKK